MTGPIGRTQEVLVVIVAEYDVVATRNLS